MKQTRLETGAQRNVVDLCHEYALLDMHDRVGLHLSSADRRSLAGLRRLLEGDPRSRRRAHRRLPLLMEARVLANGARVDGRAVNISGGGIFVVLPLELSPGTAVEVVVGREDGPHHRFNAEVRWTRACGNQRGHGLRFSAMPLRRQQPASSAEPVAGPASTPTPRVAHPAA